MFHLNFLQLLVLVCGCFFFIGLIIGWTSGWYWYKYTPEKERLERKYKKRSDSNA